MDCVIQVIDGDMKNDAVRQNNAKLLNLWIQKLAADELFIDIAIGHNSNILEDCDELAELLDECCPVRPFTGGSWSKYLPSRVGRWSYIRCNLRVKEGTASDGLPNGREVVTADRLLEVARGRQWIVEEDFDSVFD